MDRFDIFHDIAERTKGDIYLGVVGPVRTGKSTFIKKIMELLVIPHIKSEAERERARDELPQSGGGRTIMTTEPKFIPNEAVDLNIRDNVKFKIRVVDCVGYSVEGALGYEEENGPRMVISPWFEHEIPFQEAAEIGTRKVISEHSTIGLVVTTDGTITDIPRKNYLAAEERVVKELKEINKPFIIILNSTQPESSETRNLSEQMSAKYDVPVLPVDAAELGQEDILNLLQEVLYEFPVKEVNIQLPKWIEELAIKHWLREKFEQAVLNTVEQVKRLRDIEKAIEDLAGYDFVEHVTLKDMDLGNGLATVKMSAKGELFYQILEEVSGFSIKGEPDLIKLLKDLAFAKKEYDKIADALEEVRDTGYGIVTPKTEEITFEEPELVRQGNKLAIKLRAIAPSLHLIRTDIKAEVSPVVGTEKQCEELIKYLTDEFEKDPAKIWQSDFLGRSLNDLVRDGIQNKLYKMPENAQMKLKETLEKIVNEGSGGLICIIL